MSTMNTKADRLNGADLGRTVTLRGPHGDLTGVLQRIDHEEERINVGSLIEPEGTVSGQRYTHLVLSGADVTVNGHTKVRWNLGE